MKKQLAIVPLLFLSITASADEQCALDNSLDAIDELHGINCEATDKLKSCAEKVIDPEEQKKRIESWFKVAEERKEKIISEKKAVPKMSYGGLFQQDKTGSNNQMQLTHINDFMTFNGKIQNEKTAKLKEMVIEKYVKYAEQFNCDPYVKTEYALTLYPSDKKFKSKQAYREWEEMGGFEEEKQAYFNKYNSSPNNNMICDPSPNDDIREWQTVAVEYPPCAGNVAGFFKDNEWSSSTLDNKMNGPEATELAACIKDRLSKGGIIEHIKIESSASALNNSGEAAKQFCKKGFQELSEARAITARDKIVPQLFSKAGADATGLVVKTDSLGSNGDGTSGPCPYELRDGKEVLKKEFSTPSGKKSLDEHKYVRVNVSFKEIKKPVSNGDKHYAKSYRCRKFEFACQPKVMNESKVGQDNSTKQ